MYKAYPIYPWLCRDCEYYNNPESGMCIENRKDPSIYSCDNFKKHPDYVRFMEELKKDPRFKL